MPVRVPFVVDADRESINTLLRDPLALDNPPMTATDLATALHTIERESKQILGLAVSLSMKRSAIKSIVQAATKHCPHVPIILMSEVGSLDPHAPFIPKVDPLTPEEIRAYTSQDLLEHNQSYPLILDRIVYGISVKRVEAGLLFADVGDGYSPYVSAALNSGRPAIFDVFARTADNEFIKILPKDKVIDSERLRFYQSTGVASLYVRTDAQHTSVTVTIERGEEAVYALKSIGVNDESIDQAKQFVHQVGNLVNQLDADSDPLMKRLLSNLAEHDHSVSITMIASLLLKPLGINNDHGIHIIGLASLAHDIGLSHEAQILAYKDDKELTDVERKLYHQHPTTGARLLKSLKGIDPLVIKAVEQHHERRNRTGFPHGLGAGAINPFAELIGIADDFAILIEKQSRGLLEGSPLEVLSKNLQSNFSAPTVQSFRKVFRRAA